tara:strand:+ start:29 stop:400 length:372 start_codon:yes stop_codon:yes gene_type:complete
MSLKIDYKKMKVTELSAMCKERGIKKSGTKNDLITRLTNNTREKHPLFTKKINELKEMCKNHSLKVAGNKEELIERLYNNLYNNKEKKHTIQTKKEEIIDIDDYFLLFIHKMIKTQNIICNNK